MAGQWGGVRAGQGRKPMIVERGLSRLIKDVIPDDENKKLIKVIFEKALEGSFPHAKLYLEYRFGKVAENINIEMKDPGLNLSKLSESELLEFNKVVAKAIDPPEE